MRSRLLIAVVASASLPACFALFSLDGYGGPEVVVDATAETTTDSPTDTAEAAAPKRIVFVTSTVHDGALGGLDGADAICEARASAAKLPGTYRAWIADKNGSPSTRFPAVAKIFSELEAGVRDASPDGGFVETAGPRIVLVNDAFVAEGFVDLLFRGPQTPISVTEQRVTLPKATDCDEDGGLVWTNATRAGQTRNNSACGEWNSVGDVGRGGAHGAANSGDWTDSCQKGCTTFGHLYCFQQ